MIRLIHSQANTILGVIILGICLAKPVYADPDRPRYVSGGGKDVSDCLNAYRPCRSIQYALSLSGKNDSILVGEGQWEINSADAFYLIRSASYRLKGGMDKLSGYAEQKPEKVTSKLVGVPPLYRSEFQALGFSVLTDLKGFQRSEKVKLDSMLQKMSQANQNHAQADCIDNQVSGFRCSNISLYAHRRNSALLSNARSGSDIWGFFDLNSFREYAIIGLMNGAAIVDVTTPENPVVVGKHVGVESSWRDIKILQVRDENAGRWRAYAYISTEARMGLTILDLSGLPNSIEEIEFTSDFNSAHNVSLVNVDPVFGTALQGKTPLLSLSGSNRSSGGNRLYDLSDPLSPRFLANSSVRYMHDAASYSVRDARKNSQCENASNAPACEILADFNEDTFEIWDVTNPSDPQVLSSGFYSGAEYVHSGWFSEDGMYLFVHDELDELNGRRTTLRVFDVSDLTSPVLVTEWEGPTTAIDHNGFVKGNRYYMSNYTEGLTVLDISDSTQPERIAYFDTAPASSSAAFSGAWGVYPFFPSGTIAVSDIDTGLYLLKDETLAESNGNLSFSSTYYGAEEGNSIVVDIVREGGSGAVEVDVELLNFTASDDDVIVSTQSVALADGETSASLNVEVVEDGIQEGLEHFALRLVRPKNHLSLGQPSVAHLYIADAASASSVSLLNEQVAVPENNDAAYATLQRVGGLTESVSVDWEYLVSGNVAQSGTLTWQPGEAVAKTLVLDNTLDSALSRSLEFSNVMGANLEQSSLPFVVVAATNTGAGSGGGASGGAGSGGSAGANVSDNSSSGGGAMPWLAMYLFVGLLLRTYLRKRVFEAK